MLRVLSLPFPRNGMTATLDRPVPARPKTNLMNAAVITAPRTVRVERVAAATPNPQQVLVAIEGCGVCASNIPPWEGRPWFNYPMAPGALGHEAWGTIAAVGTQVTEFVERERVAMLSSNAYAEYDVADVGSVVRLPDSLGDAAFPAEPLGCAMNIFKRSCIQPNDTVAVIGIGFLGALLVQLAKAAGANVIAISRRQFALDFAQRFGADHVTEFDSQERIVALVRELTGGKFCDVVIEAVGKQNALDLASELTRERGRLVIAGYHQDGARTINMQQWNWRGLDVINAHERDPAIYLSGMREAVDAVATGRLDPRPLFTQTFPLEQLGDALNMTAERPDGFMKALVMTR
jgi:threonine dehydrogenase-like Zn-dependent dehydrogenase